MITMPINRKSYYLRKINTSAIPNTYSEYEPCSISLMPTNAESDLIALGSEYIEYRRARIYTGEKNSYSVGDLIYTKEPKYNDEVDLGNAEYKIDAILDGINVIEIRCKRLTGI